MGSGIFVVATLLVVFFTLLISWLEMEKLAQAFNPEEQ